MNLFERQAITFRNDMARSCGALLGIAQGVLADGQLCDSEVQFLRSWLHNNGNIGSAWPGNVIAAQIDAALQDGQMTQAERAHLVTVLQSLVGGTLNELADSTHVCELALDDIEVVEVPGRSFCLTGNFCFGTRAACEEMIRQRGGVVQPAVTKKLDYLVVGGLGSEEWKHGSFGTKVDKAMAYKSMGARILVVHEDPFAAALMQA
jgi:NAD-dependent DNA ligase